MKKQILHIIRPLFYCFLIFCSCKKGFLDASPNKSLAVPETLEDFQSLMDNTPVYTSSPSMQEVSADNYYVTYQQYQQQAFYYIQNCYLWTDNTYEGGTGTGVIDWYEPYGNVYIANVVLDNLSKLSPTPSTRVDWNYIKSQALFIRAFNFYNLAQLFAQPYDSATAAVDMGLPLRLTSNLDASVSRSTVKDTYARIIQDLTTAKGLMPIAAPTLTAINRPTMPALFALLARTYLTIGDYKDALGYADSCLSMDSTLLDYNTVSSSSSPTFNFPFPVKNVEVLMDNESINYAMYGSQSNVDTNLYSSYDTNDLRMTVFFKSHSGGHYFRGSYTKGAASFTGLSVDEVYLIAAECYARSGNVPAALQYLNCLLIKRWKFGTFNFFVASNASDALKMVLAERRKELCFRGIRWTDLRRLNQESNFETTLTRSLNGVIYTLQPKDLRYTLLIPSDEIRLTGIPQNPR